MKNLITAAFLMTISAATFAQDTNRVVNLKAKGAAAYNQAWAKMDETLKLTPDQTTQWQALNKSYAVQYNAIATNPNLTKDEKKTQAADLYTQEEADLAKILTPVQDAKWNAIKKTTATAIQTEAKTIKANHTTHVPRTRTRP